MKRRTDAGLVRALVEDAILAITGSESLKTQSSKRNLIRTTYAAIEGIAWLLADHVASIARDTDNISAAEQMALTEKSYQVTRQGKVREQTRFIPLPSLIRLSTTIARRVDRTFEVDFDQPEWQRFVQGLEVRNRITHPKSIDDLSVDDSDVANTIAALHWMLELTANAMATTTSALREYTNQLSQVILGLKAGDSAIWAEYLAAASQIEE